MGQRNGEANCTVLNRIICGMSQWENDTSKLEKGREFSKLISKVEHSRWREKLKQNLQSQGYYLIKTSTLPSGDLLQNNIPLLAEAHR